MPIVCGGENNNFCTKYDPLQQDWNTSGTLRYPHIGSGFVAHSQLGLIITGNRKKENQEKSEVISQGGVVKVLKMLLSLLS